MHGARLVSVQQDAERAAAIGGAALLRSRREALRPSDVKLFLRVFASGMAIVLLKGITQ